MDFSQIAENVLSLFSQDTLQLMAYCSTQHAGFSRQMALAAACTSIEEDAAAHRARGDLLKAEHCLSFLLDEKEIACDVPREQLASLFRLRAICRADQGKTEAATQDGMESLRLNPHVLEVSGWRV
ncbi:uncharacterized protein LOC101851818 isoform X2 [Aplysia californica]|uniref:Uncharacterized protein LOC101851818 isoform X2 n=2 Tax=Aplysia californica TaxID=6500 RepID=A0ABM1VYN8_APLCA|nr:uncharacterized protein LOC101851818 isoform X2 [Aplysia californica]